MDVATRRPVGVEALLRWNHPHWGAVSPASFMRTVESSRLIVAVTRFVLRTAVADMSRHAPAILWRLAVDDFGSDHSNLDLLNRFPFDFVKIDRQFVRQAESGGHQLIAGIAALPRHSGVAVIAEGVETAAQHDALRKAGIEFAQEYLYRRPLRAEQISTDGPANRSVS